MEGVVKIEKTKPLENFSDDELVEAYLENKEDKYFNVLYHRYHRMVLAIARRFTKDETDALDKRQEVFEKVLRSISSYNLGQNAFAGWITRITTNICINDFRKNTKKKEIFIPLESSAGEKVANNEPSFDTSLDADIIEEAFEKALGSLALNELDKKISRLYFVDGFPNAEIVIKILKEDQVTLNPGTLKSKIYKIKQRLKQELQGLNN